MKHIMAILISVFSLGYHGKTIDFEKYSPCHRTTVAHFLNKGKWDDAKLENILKSTVIQFIYKEAQRSGKPVFCIVDDTISSKTKPSSRALHPIEDAYFHQSHLKGKQDYGHQAVAVMLSCNGIVLKVSNPHFKWGFTFYPSGDYYWFRQRRDFAVPLFLVALLCRARYFLPSSSLSFSSCS